LTTAIADSRKWHRKKRNVARIGAAALWLVGSAWILTAYGSDERFVLWTQFSIGCAALLGYGFFIPNWIRYMRRRGAPNALYYLIMAVFACMLVYIVVLLGNAALDTAQGPVTKQVTVVDRWDPRRGADKVVLAEGGTYEVFKEHVPLEKGHTYIVKLFRHSRIVIGMERAD